jgi:hypothetical protein
MSNMSTACLHACASTLINTETYMLLHAVCQNPPTFPIEHANWDQTCVKVPVGSSCSARCHTPDFLGSPEPATTCVRDDAIAAAVWSKPKGSCKKAQPDVTCREMPPHAPGNNSITYAWQPGCKDMPLAGMCNGTATCHDQGSSLAPALATCTGAGWVLEDACLPIYLGCFRDDMYRRLRPLSADAMPTAACKDVASKEGLTLYARQYYVGCFGGSDLQFATSLGRFEGCDTPCSIGTDICGGDYANSLYSAIPIGLVCEGPPAKELSPAHVVWPLCAGLTPLGTACKGDCDPGYYAVDLVAKCKLDNVTTTYAVSGSCRRYRSTGGTNLWLNDNTIWHDQ